MTRHWVGMTLSDQRVFQ
ncbi:MAG: hypothetical protein ACKOBC_08565 [Hyphomicrobiales bacterium]